MTVPTAIAIVSLGQNRITGAAHCQNELRDKLRRTIVQQIAQKLSQHDRPQVAWNCV